MAPAGPSWSGGGLHGSYLAAERWLRERFAGYQPGPWALFGLGVLTYLLVQVTWVFFRAKTFSKAAVVLRGMFGFNTAAKPILPGVELLMVVAIIGGLVGAHWLMRARTLESVFARTPVPLLTGAWMLLAFAIVIEQGTGNAFIYFQF